MPTSSSGFPFRRERRRQTRAPAIPTQKLSLLRTGPLHRRVRLATGGILFTYVLTHLLNHCMGNISLAAMEAVLLIQVWIWQGIVGTTLFYSALVIHGLLGAAALYARRYVGWTRAEIVQIVFGLSIPILLANHLSVTRIAFTLFDTPKRYAQELVSLGVTTPWLGVVQVILLIAAWTHGCIGLHFAFRLKPFYAHARGALIIAAVLIPVLALLGFGQGVREVNRDLPDPAWRSYVLDPSRAGSPAQARTLVEMRNIFIVCYVGLIALVLALRVLRVWQETRVRGVAVTYADGAVARIPIGMSVLDASRMIRVRHASACGGRGRCSTCRVRVFPSDGALPPPSAAEGQVLSRIGADPATVRLACQLRPLGDLLVFPLVPASVADRFILGRPRATTGEERFVAVMFIDMHNSSLLAARHLAFDAVFLVRRFIELAAASVVQAGGLPNQFLGDGLLALFGLDVAPADACAQALDAARGFARALAEMNATMGRELPAKLGFGIGIHCGQAILGDVGFDHHTTFTALGEVVNVAARLQQETRRLGCDAAISDAVVRLAGADTTGFRQVALSLRGSLAPIDVHLADLAARPVAAGDGRG